MYCKEHPIKKVKYLCKVDQKLFCSKCLFQHFDHAD
ncbi:MAG: B-box zinc finger protein [bacterium]